MSRQTRLRTIMMAVGIVLVMFVSVVTVLVTVYPYLIYGGYGMMPTAGVDIDESLTGETVTATVTWTETGDADSVTVTSEDTTKNITQIGDSVMISGLEEGDLIKMIGNMDSSLWDWEKYSYSRFTIGLYTVG